MSATASSRTKLRRNQSFPGLSTFSAYGIDELRGSLGTAAL